MRIVNNILLTAGFLLFAMTGAAQYPNGIKLPTEYDYFRVAKTLGIPNDTFAVPTAVRGFPHIAFKDAAMYRWDTTAYSWTLVETGSSTTITNLGSSYRLWDPVTPGLKTLAAGTGISIDSSTANTITITGVQRFGVSGEDARSGQDRYFSLRNLDDFVIDSAAYIELDAPSATFHSYMTISPGGGIYGIAENASTPGLYGQISAENTASNVELISPRGTTGLHNGDDGSKSYSLLAVGNPYMGMYFESTDGGKLYIGKGSATNSTALHGIRIDHNDSMMIQPPLGVLNIDTLATVHGSDTANYKIMARNSVTGQVKEMTYWPSGGGGGSQNLQQVSNAGNVTTRTLISRGHSIDLSRSYYINVDSAGKYLANGWGAGFGLNSANGESYIQSTGSSGIAGNTTSWGTVPVWFQPNGLARFTSATVLMTDGADSVASRAYARSVGGGGGSGTVNSGTQYRLTYYATTGTAVSETNITSKQTAAAGNIFFNGGNTTATGTHNVGIGTNALQVTTTGGDNVSIGVNSGAAITTGSSNMLFGNQAGKAITSGGSNVAIGAVSLGAITTTSSNIGIGAFAGQTNTGSNNVFIGYASGSANISGSNNVFLGYTAGQNETGSNKLYIANSNTATPLIKGDFSASTLTINGTTTFENHLLLKDITEPSTPSAGYGALYVNSDKPYLKDDGGNVHYLSNRSRVTTITSSATPSPAATDDIYTVTALAEGCTFQNVSGSPFNGQRLVIRVTDNGTARSLGWDTNYRAGALALPTTTVISETMYLQFIYNSTSSTWDLVALVDGF